MNAWLWVMPAKPAKMGHLNMHDPIDSDHRLTQLEIKLSYAEDLLDTLNDIVARQQLQLATLQKQLLSLQNAGTDEATGAGGGFRSLLDNRPPHY